jgi:glycosyltransferase involved in cell wall biosynthesis
MKILQVINNIAWGGAGNLLINYVPLMQNQGHHIELLFLQKANCPHLKYFEDNSIKVTWLSENSLYNPFFIFKIRNFIKKGHFDIVHVHLFPAFYYVGLAAYLGLEKTKLVFTEHSTTNRRMKKLIFRMADRFIYRKYDIIISITDSIREILELYLKGLKCKHKTIINGIDLNRFKGDFNLQRQDLYENYSSSDKLIVMVARISYEKDHNSLIQAMTLLAENVHLLLIGEGTRKQECENLVANLQIDKRVHFLGVRNDVPDVLRLCDIGVLSSNWEGMPVSAIEIMAAGIPFVGSKVPGIQDLIGAKNDNAGVLFTHGDIKELAACISKLLQDRNYYQEVSEAGKVRATEYSIEKMTNQYLDAYNELINNG